MRCPACRRMRSCYGRCRGSDGESESSCLCLGIFHLEDEIAKSEYHFSNLLKLIDKSENRNKISTADIFMWNNREH
jgi:hypothetical protein